MTNCNSYFVIYERWNALLDISDATSWTLHWGDFPNYDAAMEWIVDQNGSGSIRNVIGPLVLAQPPGL